MFKIGRLMGKSYCKYIHAKVSLFIAGTLEKENCSLFLAQMQ
jgi:hypothetical protein